MEQTKGYTGLHGKIWGLNNKEAKDNGTTRYISFGLQTAKDNSIFIQVGKFKDTKLNVKMKNADTEKAEEYNEADAVDVIKTMFKDGDSVYVNLRNEVNTYGKKIDLMISQIYIEKDLIDFNTDEFEERNEMHQTVVILETPKKDIVKVGVADFKGAMIEQELRLTDEDVKNYFLENAKKGDLMRLTLRVVRKPIYEDGEATVSNTKERKTLKGKVVGGNNSGYTKRKVSSYEEYLEVTDVDVEKTEKKKYTTEEITNALDLATVKKESTKATKPTEDEDDLPY